MFRIPPLALLASVCLACGDDASSDDDGGDGHGTASSTSNPGDGGDGGPATGGNPSSGGVSETTGPAGSTGDDATTAAESSDSSGAPPVQLLFSDDFEAGAPGGMADPTKWEYASGAGTAVLSDARAMSGTQSLHVTSPSGSYETFIRTAVPFPVADNAFWGRMYFYIEELPVDDFVHWTVMEARGAGNNNRVRVGGINNPHGGDFFTHTWILNVETQGQGEIGASDDSDIPAGQWFCLEWRYDGTPGANEAQVFIDSVESESMHSLDDFFAGVYQMPTFEHLYVGWAIYQPISLPYQVWIDDVAVHDERIGCDVR